MDRFLKTFNNVLGSINDVLWHEWALFVVLGVGVLFTLWSGFSQWRALTHGVRVIRGKYHRADDPGAISPFQALSAALSATVGIGNIGGVALAVALGGPGAIFWMWVVGFVGMALKTTEVTLAMLYRNTDHPDNPHGGPMWVADLGFRRYFPALAWLGKTLAIVFCITVLISTITGGNMFQAWNVAEASASNFPELKHLTNPIVSAFPEGSRVEAARWIHPRSLVGVVLTVICGLVIIGGIKRIGAVAGALVPFMCILYLLAAVYVLAVHFTEIPGLLVLICKSAFEPLEAERAFLGGTFGYAFLWGMKRALFSNEAGQGSSPMAHCAAKTDEPVREGVVAGLEPFVDTLVVCTLTALVILASGAWNREAEARLEVDRLPAFTYHESYQDEAGNAHERVWVAGDVDAPERDDADWHAGTGVFMIARGNWNPRTNNDLLRVDGTLLEKDGDLFIRWSYVSKDDSDNPPEWVGREIYVSYVGAALTSHAFDRVWQGLGRWMVTLAVWLFAVSTVISWSYYGEQAMVYMLGERSVTPYRYFYCLCILASCLGFITTETELDNISSLGTGVMLFANIPIMLIFAGQAMSAYHRYIRRLKAGEFEHHADAK